MERAMQDVIRVHCFGCGALNERGLQIKSYWEGDEVVCRWLPQPHHIGYPGILYGGMIASIVDCHCLWTATAHAYRRAGEEMRDGDFRFFYVTGALKVNYRKPVPIDRPVELRARLAEFAEKKVTVNCDVLSGGTPAADAEVLAVRVPAGPAAARASRA
jgi:acyl-coenzyme A thioesterase PaaI-like protein